MCPLTYTLTAHASFTVLAISNPAPLASKVCVKTKRSNTSPRDFTKLLFCRGWLSCMSLLSHSLPVGFHQGGNGTADPRRGEKIAHNHWTAFNFTSVVVFKSVLSGYLLSLCIPWLFFNKKKYHITIFCWFLPARGWQGWDAVWRVPSGCWHLSSCPAYSPPAPLWRWDKTPVSPLATVETRTTERHRNPSLGLSSMTVKLPVLTGDKVTTFGFVRLWDSGLLSLWWNNDRHLSS